MATEIELIDDLDDYVNDDPAGSIAAAWESCSGPILYVIDEMGVNVDGAVVRHLCGTVWIYSDEVDATITMSRDEIARLSLSSTKPALGYNSDGTVS